MINNINLISQHANERAEAFQVVTRTTEGKQTPYFIKNNLIKECFLRAKHALMKQKGQAYRKQLKDVIEGHIKNLNEAAKEAYLSQNKDYIELFLACQRYNQVYTLSLNQTFREETVLFEELHLATPIHPESCPQLAPIKIKAEQIKTEKLLDIPANQEPHIQEKGWWRRYKLYHYNEADIKINHGKEAAHIFISTQKERLISLIGRVIEAMAKCFNQSCSTFKKYHYFKNGEDKNEASIYAQHAPLTNQEASSYWIGHATCLLHIPVTTAENEQIHVNVITDPVEGDLNKLLYPRMTRPARTMENCPLPHIYMLSHNHLDHYSKATIEKLKKYQPIMLVPEGDAKKFQKLGFKHVYEHNWWQITTIPIEQNDKHAEIKITAVPAHHWSGQGPCDGHHAAFLGYVIHQEEGDVYFAGDTARLSEEHVSTLRDRFNIRTMFQPGGPDEVRKDMETTHQASVDGLWMHFNLMMQNLYQKGNYALQSKETFMEEAKKLRTIYMHTKTYKLGNLHFDDTNESISRIEEALQAGKLPEGTKSYEEQVYHELLGIGQNLVFQDNSCLEATDILEILNADIIVPKIGERTVFAS